MSSLNWLYLVIAICSEVLATSALKLSLGFTRPWPSVAVVVGYSISFYFLSLLLRTVPVGIVYAIWSGAGICLVSLVGWLAFKQHLDVPSLIGIGLIIAGVIVLNVFSKTVAT